MKTQVANTNNEERLLVYTPQQVANILGVKPSHIKRLLRNGDLKGLKLGKFWRIPKAELDAFCADCAKEHCGKGTISDGTRNKIRFHAGLKSKDAMPSCIDRMAARIQIIKAQLPQQDTFNKIASVDKLRSAVMEREASRHKLDDMPNYLSALAQQAYPGAVDLVDEDPDALEQRFTNEANGNGNDQPEDANDNPLIPKEDLDEEVPDLPR